MAEPRKLKKPIPELRADLLADPTIKHMATTLGMTHEAYVEKVLYWAQHPDEQPELNLISDADAKAHGAATMDEVKQWFEKQLEKPEAAKKLERDEFDDAKSVSISGSHKL